MIENNLQSEILMILPLIYLPDSVKDYKLLVILHAIILVMALLCNQSSHVNMKLIQKGKEILNNLRDVNA